MFIQSVEANLIKLKDTQNPEFKMIELIEQLKKQFKEELLHQLMSILKTQKNVQVSSSISGFLFKQRTAVPVRAPLRMPPKKRSRQTLFPSTNHGIENNQITFKTR